MLARMLLMIIYCRAEKTINQRKNKQMKNFVKYMACAAVALGLAAAVHATPIKGSIGFTGTYTQVGGTAGNLASATSMTIDTFGVTSATLDLAGAGAPMTFVSSVGVNGNPPTIGQLWSVTVGPTLYTFAVTSEAQTFTSGIQLNLAGNGTISDGIPADDTAGTWQLGFGVTGASFTWQSTSGANIPDGGTTVMLLGAALSGLALIRRKLA